MEIALRGIKRKEKRTGDRLDQKVASMNPFDQTLIRDLGRDKLSILCGDEKECPGVKSRETRAVGQAGGRAFCCDKYI